MSFPSPPCHPCGLQLCPTPRTHCMISHTPPCIKITENGSLCSSLPPCTVRVTFQGGSLYTSTLEIANQNTIFTMLHLCHSHYTVNVSCYQFPYFGSAALQTFFQSTYGRVTRLRHYEFTAATSPLTSLSIKQAPPLVEVQLFQSGKLFWVLFAFHIQILYYQEIFLFKYI